MLADDFHLRRQVLNDMVLLEDVQACQAGSTAQVVPCIGMTVVKGLVFRRFPQEGVVDFVRHHGGAQGQVAGADALGQAHHVRFHAFVVAGPQEARTAEPDGDFIHDEEDVVFLRQVADAADIAFGLHEHAGGALAQRFDDHGRRSVRVFLQVIFQFLQQCVHEFLFVLHGQRSVIVGRAADAVRLEQQRAVGLVEHCDVADGNGTDGVAVVGIAQVDEGLFFRFAFVLPVLERNLQGRFHSRGTIVDIEHLVDAFGRHLDQPLRQFRRRFVDQAQQGAVFDFAKLGDDGIVDFLAVMTVDVDPQAGNGIQVFPAVRVVQLDAFAVVDDELRIFHPALHLRERMPDIFFIQFFPFIHR